MDQLSAFEISEWEAYDRIDPIGVWRGEFSLAKIESLIVNIANALYHKEGEKPVVTTPTDFMVKWGDENREPEVKQQSIEEMKQAFLAIASANKKSKKPLPKKEKK